MPTDVELAADCHKHYRFDYQAATTKAKERHLLKRRTFHEKHTPRRTTRWPPAGHCGQNSQTPMQIWLPLAPSFAA